MFLLLLSGCATPPPADPDAATRQRLVQVAESLVGTPYRYGGASLKGMDCSGLVQYTYGQVGVRVPRTTHDQFRKGQRKDDVQIGDLLFFRTVEGTEVSHVGLYTGNHHMIHAASGSKQVKKVSTLTPYWQRRLVGGITFFGQKKAPNVATPPEKGAGFGEPNG